MSEARPIGEWIRPIVARCHQMHGFQMMLNQCATAESRKQMIMTARMGDLISDDETRLLIEAYGLETA